MTAATVPAPTASSTARLARTTGVLAAIGGVAWVAAALTHAAQPVGCVGDSCATTQMRDATTLTSVLVGAAGLLLVVSGVGMVLVVRRAGRLGRAGIAGAVLGALGIATLATAVALQAAFFDDSWSLMPGFVIPGVLAVVVGAILLGWNVIASGLVPRWAGACVIVAAVLLPFSNEQTDAVLLAIPFGVAWAVLGLTLRPEPAR